MSCLSLLKDGFVSEFISECDQIDELRDSTRERIREQQSKSSILLCDQNYSCVICEKESLWEKALEISRRTTLPLYKKMQDCDYGLLVKDSGLELWQFKPIKLGPLKFESHRLKGFNHLLAKAIGFPKNNYIVDMTAGLGSDLFSLYQMGAKVIGIERSPLVFEILSDAIALYSQISLYFGDSKVILEKIIPQPQVVYLDPMFPSRNKRALPKKHMQILESLIGYDKDEQELLEISLEKAQNRVVLKRPLHAPITYKKPHFSILGKMIRYDVWSKG